MRIACPSCAAAYEVPDARIVPGQAVRCARCGTDWTPVAEPLPVSETTVQPPLSPGPKPPPIPNPALPFPDTPVVRPPTLRAPKFDRPNFSAAVGSAVLAGWIVSVAVVVGLGWAAVTWRSDVMRAWPPSERLYTALGLPAGR